MGLGVGAGGWGGVTLTCPSSRWEETNIRELSLSEKTEENFMRGLEATLITAAVKPQPPPPPASAPLPPAFLCRGGDETLISSIRERVPQMFAMRWLLAAADLCDHGNQPVAVPPPRRLSVSPLCQKCCCCCASPPPPHTPSFCNECR